MQDFKKAIIFDRKAKKIAVPGIASDIYVRRLPINSVDKIADSMTAAETKDEKKNAAARAVATVLSNDKGEQQLNPDEGNDIDWILDNFEIESMLAIVNGCFDFNGMSEKKVDTTPSLPSSSEIQN